MKLFKNSLWIIVFIAGSLLNFSACKNKPQKKQAPPAKNQKLEDNNKPSEEEIKYFFPTGAYDLSISTLGDYEEIDGYSYVYPSDIEGKNIIDPKGGLLTELDIKNMFEMAEIGYEEYEGELYYKTKEKIDTYKYDVIDEWYSLGAVKVTFFCIKPKPTAIPEDLILDNNFIVRLYDKNGKVIDEHKMRNETHFETYKKDPTIYQKKISISGVSSAHLIGMLKLPPKDQREGLKYRVLRLDKNGNSKPYLYEGAYKDPLQYYLWEDPLPPYSEYKDWKYSEETGCYSKAVYPEPRWMWDSEAPLYSGND